MEKQRKISLATYVISLIIMLIIIGVIAFVIVSNKKESTTLETSNGGNVAQIQNQNVTGGNDNAEITQNLEAGEAGERIAVDSELVTKIREKFDFSAAGMRVIHNIYENEGKTTETFSNEFKLLLGWHNLISDMDLDENGFSGLPDGVTGTYNGDPESDNAGTGSITATKEAMERSIKSIFGEDVTYTDSSFENVDCHPFWTYDQTAGTITYSNGVYTSGYFEGGGGPGAWVYEYLSDAIKYSNKVEIYVTTVFCEVEAEPLDSSGEECTDVIYAYSDFDASTKELKNKVGTISFGSTDIQTDWASEEECVEACHDVLKTYKYTFNLDSSTGEYYFAGFELAELQN